MHENKNKLSLEGYKALLKFMKKSKLKFSSFGDKLNSGRKIILRHDIDFCPTRALQIAKLENKLSISSTYFFLINTEFYNLQFEANKKILKEILSLGHHIGLHFDASFYRTSEKLNLECKREDKVLENIINKKVKIISFHRPSEKILNMNRKIGGLEHTYMNKFIADIFYCSDSQGCWRYSNPYHIINKVQTLN